MNKIKKNAAYQPKLLMAAALATSSSTDSVLALGFPFHTFISMYFLSLILQFSHNSMCYPLAL